MRISDWSSDVCSSDLLQLPLGAIRPGGWLKEQLQRMKTGLTGHLDQKYASVVGSRNAWLGGDGDAWERGPYWIDGLLPLAYILNDKELIAKVQPWVRSEEHTSELQSLMRISYDVFC